MRQLPILLISLIKTNIQMVHRDNITRATAYLVFMIRFL